MVGRKTKNYKQFQGHRCDTTSKTHDIGLRCIDEDNFHGVWYQITLQRQGPLQRCIVSNYIVLMETTSMVYGIKLHCNGRDNSIGVLY